MAKAKDSDSEDVDEAEGGSDESTSEKKPKKQKKVKAPPGPLAPFKLSLAVCASALTTGLPLLNAWSSGVDVDIALGRSFGVAFLLWIVLGKVSRMLGTAQLEAEVERRRAAMHAVTAPAAPTPAVDDDHDIHHAA